MLTVAYAIPEKIRSFCHRDKELDLIGVSADVDLQSFEDQKHAKKVAIIGAGWMGRALARRIVDANYSVVVGSRSPEQAERTRFEIVCEHVSVAEACRYGDIIILAVPQSAHKNLYAVLEEHAMNKIVIDCSNRKPHKKYHQSAAEELQLNLQGCHVVKAFNDTSAYELSSSNPSASDKQLRYCGNNEEAKACVRVLLENIGATPRFAQHVTPH